MVSDKKKIHDSWSELRPAPLKTNCTTPSLGISHTNSRCFFYVEPDTVFPWSSEFARCHGQSVANFLEAFSLSCLFWSCAHFRREPHLLPPEPVMMTLLGCKVSFLRLALDPSPAHTQESVPFLNGLDLWGCNCTTDVNTHHHIYNNCRILVCHCANMVCHYSISSL